MLEQWHSTQFMEVESPASDVDLPAVQNSASLHVQIFVRDLSDTTRVIHVGLDSHISDVKRVICAKAQTSADAYYLTYIGKRLEDGRSLLDYGVLNGSTLLMNGRCLGAGV